MLSPLLEQLQVLDLSMGTLSDLGAEVLLNCSAVNQLDTLDVSANFLSDEMIAQLSQLSCRVIAGEQKEEYEEEEEEFRRYCSVAE